MNDKLVSLSSASFGDSVKITDISRELSVRQRLEELGFRKGAVIDKLYAGFGGSPIAVRVSGAVIAVREEDCRHIEVATKE